MKRFHVGDIHHFRRFGLRLVDHTWNSWVESETGALYWHQSPGAFLNRFVLSARLPLQSATGTYFFIDIILILVV